MSQELKPCPFCGGRARINYVSDHRISYPRTGRRIVCGNCAIQTSAFDFEEEAVSTWNRRYEAQQPAQAPCGTVTAYEDSTGQHYQFTPSWGWVGTRRFDVFEAPPAQTQQSDRVTPEMFQQLQEQVKTLKEIGERKIDGCECSAEDACRFAMERDEARALVAELKAQQAAGVPEAGALVEALHKIKHKAVSLADAQVIALEALAAATEAAQVTDALKSARMATSQDDGRFRVVLQFTEFDDANAVHSWLMSQGVLHYNGPGSHATQAQAAADARDAQPMIPLSMLRPIAVEAIRSITGCPDLRSGDRHLTDEIEAVAIAALAAHQQGGN